MDNVERVVEFDDDIAKDKANGLLERGWKLLHVGTKLIDIIENGQAYYNTAYVLGGSKSQYEQYQKDLNGAFENF